MIQYSFGVWGQGFIYRCHGSVTRKAIALVIPSALICVLCHHYYRDWLQLTDNENLNVSQAWASYNWTLGFLLAFRTQQAYSRYWEGVSLLQQVRGEWFNATSSLIAFCSPDMQLKQDVDRFQHLLVRLVSLLYCSGLQTVSAVDDCFRVLDVGGLDQSCLMYLEGNAEKCEVILQWIQRLIMDQTRSGVVPTPPPIVSRVFQELSRGVVNLNNARKIADIPFPFPYAQLISCLLNFHVIIAPIVTAAVLNSLGWAVTLTCVQIWTLWGLNFVAADIESPFGDAPNDLPLSAMMDDMNTSLWTLLDRRTQIPPSFSFEPIHTKFKSTIISRSPSSHQNTFPEQLNQDMVFDGPVRSLRPSRTSIGTSSTARTLTLAERSGSSDFCLGETSRISEQTADSEESSAMASTLSSIYMTAKIRSKEREDESKGVLNTVGVLPRSRISFEADGPIRRESARDSSRGVSSIRSVTFAEDDKSCREDDDDHYLDESAGSNFHNARTGGRDESPGELGPLAMKIYTQDIRLARSELCGTNRSNSYDFYSSDDDRRGSAASVLSVGFSLDGDRQETSVD